MFSPSRRRLATTCLTGLLAVLPATLPAQADAPPAASAWETIPNPETNTGLVNSPRLLNIRNRIMIFWAGTSELAKQPEIFFTSRQGGDGDDKWAPSRPPFFGQDFARVRKLAVATARDMMGIVFERETGSGVTGTVGSMEVHMSTSRDFGYSFGTPFLLDSFVLGEASGSYVTAGARQGTQAPEFAVSWVAEGGAVRAASINTRGDRPEAVSVGHVDEVKTRAEMMGAGTQGFFLIWPENGMKTAHVKPLQGGPETAMSLAKGSFGNNYSVCYNYRGPGYAVMTSDNGDVQVLEAKGDKFEPKGPPQKDPVRGKNLESRTALDGDRRIHRLTLDPNGNHLIYSSFKDGKWSEPQPICDLRPDLTSTGIDIAVCEDYVWVCASQAQILTIRRHKFK